MARYKAKIWTSGCMPYEVETNASTYHDAQRILARREGVPASDVRGIEKLYSDSNSTSSSSSSHDDGDGVDLQTVGIVLAAMVGLWIIATFWWIFGIIGLIVAARWFYNKFVK